MSQHWGRAIKGLPADPDAVKRMCRRCKKPKPIKGGSIKHGMFVCEGCKA